MARAESRWPPVADGTKPVTRVDGVPVRRSAQPDRISIGRTSATRPRVDGKFFYVGGEKLLIRGVTYGPFASRAPGDDGYDPPTADHDFREMARHGVNAV